MLNEKRCVLVNYIGKGSHFRIILHQKIYKIKWFHDLIMCDLYSNFRPLIIDRAMDPFLLLR